MLRHAELTGLVIRRAYAVYNSLGSGFHECVYSNALAVELREAGLQIAREWPIPLYYKNHDVGDYFADFIVEEKLILELKAVEALKPCHSSQLLNYLRFSGIELGLLINFGWERIEIARRISDGGANSKRA